MKSSESAEDMSSTSMTDDRDVTEALFSKTLDRGFGTGRIDDVTDVFGRAPAV